MSLRLDEVYAGGETFAERCRRRWHDDGRDPGRYVARYRIPPGPVPAGSGGTSR
ncbi:hypothetical protein J2S41_000205 [Catenuloplanes atrovinosus]|uniref:Uncharacterized protein n=1 Tax=Catenuloplanes atrovinosus TaxID=137266 RepID=A0AAE3YI86_9ACTN|nr:hypothetical protein [Catenuloplanes atrovinosus]